jgi:hypothetical protein
MKKFITDIFKEDKKEDKFSSKKTVGIISAVLAFLAFIVDGFHFYDINDGMFDSMLIFSGTMLGASVVKSFSKASQEPSKKEVL